MIVKGKINKSLPPLWVWVSGLAVICLMVALYKGNDSGIRNDDNTIICDAENVEDGFFISDGQKFTGGDKQSSKESFSGTYSTYVEGKKRYAMSYTVESPVVGATYIARVWRKTNYPQNSRIVIKTDNNTITKGSDEIIWRKPNGWEQIEVKHTYRGGPEMPKLVVFCYINTADASAYFDDLSITVSDDNKVDIALNKSLHITLMTRHPEN